MLFFLQGLLSATITWFQNYKVLDGKSPNKFAFGKPFQGFEYAVRVIEEVPSASFDKGLYWTIITSFF